MYLRMLPVLVTSLSFMTLAACSTTNGPAPGGSSGGVSSGGSGAGGGSTASFTGTWISNAVAFRQTCQGKTQTSTSSDTLTISASGSQLQATTSDGCSFSAIVNGQVASESPADQECVPSSSSVTLVYASFAFVVDGASASLSATGSFTQSGISCTFSNSGTYTKL